MQYDDYNYGYLAKNADYAARDITIKFEVPILKEPKEVDFSKAIPITEIWNTKDFKQGVHFYVHDRYFIKYLEPKLLHKLARQLKKFDFVVAPDFTLLECAPEQNRVMNISRNMQFASFLQEKGVNVVANVRCLGKESYKYALIGFPKYSTICIGSYGNIKEIEIRKLFLEDYAKIMETLKPKRVIIYGFIRSEMTFFYPEVEFIQIENYTKLKLSKKSVHFIEKVNGRRDNFGEQSLNHFTTNIKKVGNE